MYMAAPFFFFYIVFAVISPYIAILFRGLGYGPFMIGILLGVFEGAGVLGPFILGHFADKIGRYKPGLLITNGLVLAAALPLALFRDPVLSALFALILGLGFRSALPLLEAVTTIAIGKTGDYGKIRTAGSVSFIFMTLFFQAALILPVNTPINIALWIVITTLFSIISIIFIPQKYEKTRRRETSARVNRQEPQDAARGTRKIWSAMLAAGLIIMALNRLGMSSVYGFFSLYLTESLQWDAVGLMWALASMSEVPFMFLSRRIINRFGAFNCLAASTAALILRMLLYACFPFKAGIILAQTLHSLCFGLFHPAAIAFISTCVPPERRALGMSLYLSLGSGLPSLVGNILGGFIVEHAGYPAMFGIFTVFPVIAVGIYAVIVLQRRK
ncbi:MAG: MFS transporter [Treponema sp.]|jgi:PPP family 3-phenylpropionic acid transporter|nr:MFS transporter [Treponema sp.]